jgi:FAD/FMN-containing dehydrogenase
MVATERASGDRPLSVEALARALGSVLDGPGFIPGAEAGDRYRRDWGGHTGAPLAVLRPATPDAVAPTLRILSGLGHPVVPQGGMTGLVKGGLPVDGEIVLSLERLTAIEAIDADAQTARVQAGVPLQALQEAAEAEDLFFPVDIGARGSAAIGGMISTNAGGNRVLRFGMMRASVLGLEAVLADGTVVSRLNGLVKDNAGYDLKHLFIGAEGTLGVVTRAVLQLQPRPSSRATALVSVGTFGEVVALLRACRRGLGPMLGSFEAMWPGYWRLVTADLGLGRDPFAGRGGILVLVEALGFGPVAAEPALETVLGETLAALPGADAVLARSIADADGFWRLRDAASEAARAIAPYLAFDVSLPLAEMGGWVEAIEPALRARGLRRIQIYGHLGDGNLHLTVGDLPADPAFAAGIEDLVAATVGPRGGSISAEHGIGRSKKRHLGLCRSEAEIALMRRLKAAVDPGWMLSPGRIFDPGDAP